MIYKAKLVKVSDNPNAFRGTEMVGWTPLLPEVGKSFLMFGDPLVGDPAEYVRKVSTSTVQRVEHIDDTEVFIITLNSTYKLTDIKTHEDEVF